MKNQDWEVKAIILLAAIGTFALVYPSIAIWFWRLGK